MDTEPKPKRICDSDKDPYYTESKSPKMGNKGKSRAAFVFNIS